MIEVIKTLIDLARDLAIENAELQLSVEHLSDELHDCQQMVTQLEAKVNGWSVENTFIQLIDRCQDEIEAKEALQHLVSQDGFRGGRFISDNRLQTFWIDGDPPATWVDITIANKKLPDGLRYVCVPPALQKSLFWNELDDRSEA